MEVAASIIAVVQLTDRIVSVCRSYIEGVKDYPKDLRVIYLEVKSLAVIFETLRFMDQTDPKDAAILSHLEGHDGPIEGCRKTVEALSSLLSPSATISSSTGTQPRNKTQKIQDSLASFAWPLKANQAQKLMEELNRHKSTINIAIGGTIL